MIAPRVHFVGIGGAGMSAIARVMLERGARVSGSDLKRSPTVEALVALGADVHIGHDARLVDGCTEVVVSAAIPARNPEVTRARAAGIRVIGRGQALAELLGGRRSIVVAGTHGKSTTTSMIVAALSGAGLEPGYLVGGELNDAGTNARWGSGDLVVAESDESDGSFLLLAPHVGVVTNVDADHLDHWGSEAAIRAAFGRWIDGIDARGAAVVPDEEDELVARARAASRRTVTFGPRGDVIARDVVRERDGVDFTLRADGREARVRLQVPGHHNVANALAAAAAALQVGVSLADVARGLEGFTGVGRRFERLGTARGVTVVDDYAHHPNEVRAVLAAARGARPDRLVAVFQPHRFSRVSVLGSDFGASLGAADKVVVTDVYGAGEEPVPGVTGKLVADATCARYPGRAVAYLPHRAELLDYLERDARPGDLVLTLGAGDITSVGGELIARLRDGG